MRLTSREAREYRREMIVRLYESGKSQKEISNLVSVDQSVVSRVVQDYRSGKSLKETVNICKVNSITFHYIGYSQFIITLNKNIISSLPTFRLDE